MKRLIINLICLCICTCLVLCACGKKDKERGSNNNHETVAEEAQEEKWGFDINYVNPDYVKRDDDENLIDLSEYVDVDFISADSTCVIYRIALVRDFDLIPRWTEITARERAPFEVLNNGVWEGTGMHIKKQYDTVITEDKYIPITKEGVEITSSYFGVEYPKGHYRCRVTIAPTKEGVITGIVDNYYTEFEFDIE